MIKETLKEIMIPDWKFESAVKDTIIEAFNSKRQGTYWNVPSGMVPVRTQTCGLLEIPRSPRIQLFDVADYGVSKVCRFWTIQLIGYRRRVASGKRKVLTWNEKLKSD